MVKETRHFYVPKNPFLFQFICKYVGPHCKDVYSWKRSGFGDLSFFSPNTPKPPPVYFNSSYCMHMFII